MTPLPRYFLLFWVGVLAGCDDSPPAEPLVAPAAISAEAIGLYCGMNLLDHPGPKGQIHLRNRNKPVWLASVRDTFAFLMLPDEPKNVRAVFVSDMGAVSSPATADPGRWVEARRAWYVTGSRAPDAMTGAELYPFSEELDARKFVARHGGGIRRFADIRPEEVLGSEDETVDLPALGEKNHAN